jgi:hypothetical protein
VLTGPHAAGRRALVSTSARPKHSGPGISVCWEPRFPLSTACNHADVRSRLGRVVGLAARHRGRTRGWPGRLHELLLRIARGQVHRRSSQPHISGPELEDMATRPPPTPCRRSPPSSVNSGREPLTTWVYKFAVFEVSSKIGRHFWRNPAVAMDAADWDRLPDRFGLQPPGSRSGETWWPRCTGRWTRR